LHHSDQEPRQGLAEEYFSGPQRSYQQLVERALFAFTRHGHCCDEDGGDQRQHADDAGNEEPPAFEIRVEPGARFQVGRHARLAALAHPLPVELVDDAAHVVHGHHCRIGISTVDDDLHGGFDRTVSA